MSSYIWRVLVLALMIASAACSSKKDGADSAAASDATQEQAKLIAAGQEVPGGDREARAKELGALVDLIVNETNELPRAEFDPAALAAKLGKDPQAHFNWVREHTWWAPYRGLLRGSMGVLLDRVGSSLDRAVLLGDLLRRSGYSVRLAHAELTEAQARQLMNGVQPMPDRRWTQVASRAISAERQRAIDAILPDHEKDYEKQIAESGRRLAAADALIRSQTEALLAAVRQAANPEAPDDAAALEALRDHWWVEREENGKWVAMDTLLPEAKDGATRNAASSIVKWPASEVFPSIPDSEWHTVDIRVVVERYEAGETSEAVVLEEMLRPAVVLGRPLRLFHMPVPWPDTPPDPKGEAQAFRDAALSAKLWVPVLQVGDDRIMQSGFTVDGDLKSELVESVNDMRRAGGAEVVSGMDMALGGFSAEEFTPSATAEWLDYEVRVPGAATQKLRRQVFDLLGPARRSSKATDFNGTADLRKLERFEALWSQTDILLQPCNFTGEFVAHLASAGIVANQKALMDLAEERDAAMAKAMSSEILRKIWIWGPLPNLALWRTAIGGQSTDWFLNRPNVLNYRISRKVVDSDGSALRQLMDVASNGVAARNTGDDGGFAIRLRQGVADTVAEMATLGSDLREAENTASIFARLASDNSRGFLINAGDSAAAHALPWPPDEIARVAADVEAGFMVVVPRKAVVIADQERVGWWRVNPASGETIGVMDTGFHAETSEYSAAQAQKNRLFTWLYEEERYRDWQTLKLMAEHNLRMTAQQAYNLRLFNLTQKVIENIQFFAM
ncbi:MAG: hypothetical protein ACRER4_03250 [Steroidobacteraceae bacterium]